jgi:hypothetical protein
LLPPALPRRAAKEVLSPIQGLPAIAFSGFGESPVGGLCIGQLFDFK